VGLKWKKSRYILFKKKKTGLFDVLTQSSQSAGNFMRLKIKSYGKFEFFFAKSLFFRRQFHFLCTYVNNSSEKRNKTILIGFESIAERLI